MFPGKAVEKKFVNVQGWYKSIESLPKMMEVMKKLPKGVKALLSQQAGAGRKEESKFDDLLNQNVYKNKFFIYFFY